MTRFLLTGSIRTPGGKRTHVGTALEFRGTPRFKPGDQIVWYATTWGVLYGLAEVTGRPEQRQVRDWQGDRWPWYPRSNTARSSRPIISANP
jgi:hypothetical protein